MRLQLIALLLIARTASAQPADGPSATAMLHVYADDDHVTVISPSASTTVLATPSLAVATDMTVDAVTAASVDVVTSASPRTVEEQRVELGIAGTYRFAGPTWLTLGARGSHEHDYDALRTRLTARRELAQRNTTLEATYVLGDDVAHSVMDAAFRRTRTSHELMVTASQLLGPRTVLDLIGDGTIANGYHASPYRSVLIDQPSWPLAMRVDEVTPSLRASLAVAARLRRALPRHSYASAMYRFYADDWSITSHTATAEVAHAFGHTLTSVLARGYVQDAAYFYRAHYDEMTALRTRDRTLGAMRSAYVAVTGDVRVAESWHVVGGVGALRWWFLDFPAQANRNALLVHASVTTSW